jgi:hypothetical protein
MGHLISPPGSKNTVWAVCEGDMHHGALLCYKRSKTGSERAMMLLTIPAI